MMRRLIRSFITVLGLTFICSCSFRQQATAIRMATVNWPGYQYFYLAQKENLDAEFGLRLHVDQLASLHDERLAYIRGDAEAIATTLPDAIAICREVPSRCPYIVLVIDHSNGADYVLAQKSIGSLAALKGRSIGMERSVLAEYMLLSALDRSGLTKSDVDLTYAIPAALVEGLSSGRFDAIISYVPHGEELIEKNEFKVLFDSSQIPGQIVDVLAVSPQLLRTAPAVVNSLVDLWWESRRYVAEYPDKSYALMAQASGISAKEFIRLERLIYYPSRSEQINLLDEKGPVKATLGKLQSQVLEAGLIPRDLKLPILVPPKDK